MTKPAKVALSIVLLVILILLIVRAAHAPLTPGKAVKIGVIAPLTGVVADYGEEMRKGVMSVASSTSGEGVEFVFEDEKCDPKETVTAYKKLVEFEKVNFIIGPGCGSPQEAIVPLIKENNTVVIVPSAASRGLFEKSGKNFFDIQYSLEDESTFIANELNTRGYKKVALVTYQNAFSETHAAAFKAAFKGEIVAHVLKDETSDVSSEVAKIKTEKPDAIYAPDINFFFGNGMVKLNQYGVTAPVYSTYVAELPAVRDLVPGVIYSFPGDIAGTEGAVFNLTKQAAQVMADAVKACGDSALCVKEKLGSSGSFDSTGVYKRTIILKQIKDKKPVLYTF